MLPDCRFRTVRGAVLNVACQLSLKPKVRRWGLDWKRNAKLFTTGPAVSTVTARADDAADCSLPGSVCRAVIKRTPSARSLSPSVVTTVVGPAATAEPTGTPSARIVTVAPATVPDTENWSAD